MGEARHKAKLTVTIGTFAGLVATLAGCTSSQPVATAQTASLTPTVVESNANPAPRETAPRKTGTYPTFGKPLTAANVQLSDTEASSIEAQVTALGAQKRAGNVSEAEYKRRLEELRKLANAHGEEALSEIAN
ncbi:hypothetical protein MRS76_18495 [Rhizobiaceae bacterium n13]|uniref:SHOCT domain-containing protein n=1 Tax=Ferirhizobium litorale TaxID=2927786 RepID=A0AAE3U3V7_9HYPH|nr:hypothetical protein [Fererhizobium litorale]MDI7863946.1 hypothetical protein [Fererhizobium litorale]MDI7924222.1 hypothetical protein [Fererhizobium litorale]